MPNLLDGDTVTFKSAAVASARVPGIFAPVGSDFVIGCDYMETRPDDFSVTGAPLVYRCDNRYTWLVGNLRGNVAALLVYGRSLKESHVAQIVSHFKPRWGAASPPPSPPPMLSPPPPKSQRGLPSDLMPDVAFFDAGDRASLSVDSKTGRVTAQRDIMASPQLPRPALAWSGDCRWDATAGGAVVLDGKSCFARLDEGRRLCDWDSGMLDGFTMVVVAQLGPSQQQRATLMSSLGNEIDIAIWHRKEKMLVWRPDQVLTRALLQRFTAPENENSTNPYDDDDMPDAGDLQAFAFRKMPSNAWTLDALVAKPLHQNGTARYYRGTPAAGASNGSSAGARKLFAGPAAYIQPPLGRDFALGCDFIKFEVPELVPDYGEDYNQAYERRCEVTSYLRGRLAAVLIYGRQLAASDVTRLVGHYRSIRWPVAAAPAASPAPSPPQPPVQTGAGLPAALGPDIGYFDAGAATASRLVVSEAGAATASSSGKPASGASAVRSLLDARHPQQQRLDWFGDCRYDSSAGGGSILLDGSSCYAQLSTDMCAQWQMMLNSDRKRHLNFSLVVVMHLDGSLSPPPPKPPLAPAIWNDGDLGVLDTGGMGILSYGMQDGGYYFFGGPSMHWTTKATYMTMDGATDYGDIDAPFNSLPVPRGVWSMEAITSKSVVTGPRRFDYEKGYAFYRGTSAQAAGNISLWRLNEHFNFPPPDGTELRVGCTWRDTDVNYDCKPGSHLRGWLSAVLVYGRTLSERELGQLHAHFSKRWAAAAAKGR
ncbi:hypothetical protein HYH02_006518 [Chlamydomonas schloesseri]|uniref:Uncharacterized protein n=1 Tax=Chlamydomonas schloesseri TaxID=2026947 RepID=A0A835WJK0_9CHLO|nr:hypothetical protein HYH02_006518 [Chlamydomonas schloesseri]|eukprot:KAG2448630.1 hypothetical protein HYH02_006518 [Chlamydomonas schloesseri]